MIAQWIFRYRPVCGISHSGNRFEVNFHDLLTAGILQCNTGDRSNDT